jgi:hypothetical protein
MLASSFLFSPDWSQTSNPPASVSWMLYLYVVLWIWSILSNTHVLKAQPLAGGTIEKKLDHKGINLIAEQAIRRWNLVRGVDHWEHAFERYIFFMVSSLSFLPSLCSLAATRWTTFLHYAFSQPWNETSETMRQNKSFLLLNCLSQVLCHNNGNWLRWRS